MTCTPKTIHQGDQYVRTLTFKDNAGVLINMTGSTVSHYIKDSLSSATILKTTSLTMGGALGTATLDIVMDLTEGQYIEAFIWTKSNAKKETFGERKIIVKNNAN